MRNVHKGLIGAFAKIDLLFPVRIFASNDGALDGTKSNDVLHILKVSFGKYTTYLPIYDYNCLLNHGSYLILFDGLLSVSVVFLSYYLAIAVLRRSRTTVTRICPGYSISLSIRPAISVAIVSANKSLIRSGSTMTRISRPA